MCKTDTKKTQESEQGENRERKTVCLSEIKTEKERGRKRFCGGTESLEGVSVSHDLRQQESVSHKPAHTDPKQPTPDIRPSYSRLNVHSFIIF